MNITENKKALDASIRIYRKTVKLFKDNIGKYINKNGWGRPTVSAQNIPHGILDCPLCRLYYRKHCVGCCIANDTGQACCYGTPYRSYSDLLYTSKKIDIRLIDVAKAELEYLEGLRRKLDCLKEKDTRDATKI